MTTSTKTDPEAVPSPAGPAALGRDPTEPVLTNVTPQMLQEAERELQELLSRKKAVDKSLIELERKIYLIEGSYLEDTNHGNIIRGFDGYLTNSSSAHHAPSTKKKHKLTEEDRLFSRSSVTYPKALEMKERGRGDEEDDEAVNAAGPSGYRATPTPASRVDKNRKSGVKKRTSSVLTPDLDTPAQRKKRRGDDDE
ncbi:Chromatin modification- protein meaf6 [Thoreauomyces humboldtii]|nr:Chromatin modification- protein meaf6 [Thoreauomyces humboldtii]